MSDIAPAPTWVPYYQVCLAHSGVVKRVERVLDDFGTRSISVREAADSLGGYGATYDQVASVLAALHSAGVLRTTSSAYTVDPEQYARSAARRSATLEALSWVRTAPDQSGECELVLAVPADATALVGEGYHRDFFDLRTAIRNIVAEAQTRVLLAAPYWDLEVATDLAELLRRRQEVGVRIAILARQPQAGSANERALTAIKGILPESSTSSIRILERPSSSDPFGTSTFHFKAACADARRVYLGSANFNTAGLGSRWELGVLLGGRRARLIADFIETLWASSRPL